MAISPRSLAFLVLSGLCTGASWICYFKALSLGDVNKVVPVDKSSTVLSVLLAVVLFSETGHLAVKLAGTAVITAGTLAMIERHQSRGGSAAASPDGAPGGRSWLAFALLSAVFAALTSVLAKVGIEGVESNLGTAVRTVVAFVMAWGIVAARGMLPQLRGIDRRGLAFVCASGVATGASWLCYYYALQAGLVSVVVQIDKLSILVSVAFSRLVLGERRSRRAAMGLAAIVAGMLAMTAWA